MRAKILVSARDAILRYGLRKTTMEDIAMAMGRAKSFLYYYFSSKQDVVRALIEHEFEEMSQAVMDEVATKTNAVDRVRTYLVTRVQQLDRRIEVYSGPVLELRHDDGSTIVLTATEQRRAFDTLEERYFANLVMEGIRDGSFRPLSEAVVLSFAQVALSAIRDIELQLMLDRDAATDLKSRVEMACDIFFRGLLA